MAGAMSGTRGAIIVFLVVGTVAYGLMNQSSSPPSTSGQGGIGAPAAAASSSTGAQAAPTVGRANNGGAASTLAADDAEAAPASKWTYEDQKDELRGITSHFAMLESENTLNFGFPYGDSTGKMVLRRKGKSSDVMIQISGGQFLCNAFNGDTVVVKFDDDAIRHFECAESSDGDTKVIFLRNAGRFVKGLKESSRVQIEAQFFQAGLQQLAFNSAGLKW